MSLKDGCPECASLGYWCRECQRRRDVYSNAVKTARWRLKRLEDAQQIECRDCRALQVERLVAHRNGPMPKCSEHSGVARREREREAKRHPVHFQCLTCGVTVTIQHMEAHLASKSHAWYARPARAAKAAEQEAAKAALAAQREAAEQEPARADVEEWITQWPTAAEVALAAEPEDWLSLLDLVALRNRLAADRRTRGVPPEGLAVA